MNEDKTDIVDVMKNTYNKIKSGEIKIDKKLLLFLGALVIVITIGIVKLSTNTINLNDADNYLKCIENEFDTGDQVELEGVVCEIYSQNHYILEILLKEDDEIIGTNYVDINSDIAGGDLADITSPKMIDVEYCDKIYVKGIIVEDINYYTWVRPETIVISNDDPEEYMKDYEYSGY